MNRECKIVSCEELVNDNYKLIFKCEEMAKVIKPGQFLNVRCSEDTGQVLRRPISVYNVDKDNIEIIFQIRGVGTKKLAGKKCGNMIDVMGPLGKGFMLDKKYKNIAFVGGGIGIYPLYYTNKKMPNAKSDVFLGFRTKDDILVKDEFEKLNAKVFISTDDGSEGEKGFITDVFKREYLKNKYDMVFICGPEVMSKKIAEIVHSQNKRCQVSIEERMGCGIGACLVCNCKTKKDGKESMSHVCVDGPVFWSDEVYYEGKNK